MVTNRDHWTDLEAMGFEEQEGVYDTRIEAEETIAEYEGKEDPIFHELKGMEGLQVEDILQMEFCTPEEARYFYNSYSRLKGFFTRQGKKLEMADRKREHKVVTRCGCLAEMRIKRKDGSDKWYVSRFLDNHNHELVAGKYVDYLRSHRGLSDVEISHLTSLREVGISIPKIYQSFAAQNGDVNAAVRCLEGVAHVDNRMYWRYRLGEDNNMCDLFWSDGCSQLDYGIFGDVLAFNATYGRNKYNLPVVVFSRVNHHNQTCVLGRQ
ncbi:hypothetical protein AHAS_Ahas17G0292900 [Arachis hypogaea]